LNRRNWRNERNVVVKKVEQELDEREDGCCKEHEFRSRGDFVSWLKY
jgi:hypothetical protein